MRFFFGVNLILRFIGQLINPVWAHFLFVLLWKEDSGLIKEKL